MKRFKFNLDYLTTEAGRRLVFTAAGFTTISLFVGNFLPHTILLNKYREFLACYRNGLERELSPKVLKRLEKAFDKLNINSLERRYIKPFTVFGFDIVEAGSTKYRYGGILGIPVNYAYDSERDFDKGSIVFRNEPIKWSSASGKLLLEAIVLTEEEQIFGICKGIMQLQTNRVLLNSLFPSVSFLLVYTVGNYLNQSLNLFQRALSVRLILYSLLGMFGIGIWTFMKDFNQVQYDTDIDKKLCELGPEFVTAGCGYYEKLLKKNMALRELIGDNTYTAKGNLNYFLRQKSLPLTIRKSYFEMRLKELKETLEKPTADAAA